MRNKVIYKLSKRQEWGAEILLIEELNKGEYLAKIIDEDGDEASILLTQDDLIEFCTEILKKVGKAVITTTNN